MNHLWITAYYFDRPDAVQWIIFKLLMGFIYLLNIKSDSESSPPEIIRWFKNNSPFAWFLECVQTFWITSWINAWITYSDFSLVIIRKSVRTHSRTCTNNWAGGNRASGVGGVVKMWQISVSQQNHFDRGCWSALIIICTFSEHQSQTVSNTGKQVLTGNVTQLQLPQLLTRPQQQNILESEKLTSLRNLVNIAYVFDFYLRYTI